MLTSAEVTAALAEIRADLPGASVTININGETLTAIEIKNTRNQETSPVGVVAGEVGAFHLAQVPTVTIAEGDCGTIVRDGKEHVFRVVGISEPYDGYRVLHYGDKHGRGAM